MSASYVPWQFETNGVLLILDTESDIDTFEAYLIDDSGHEEWKKAAKGKLNSVREYKAGVVCSLREEEKEWQWDGWCSLPWYEQYEFYESYQRIHLSDIVCHIKYDDEFEALFS